MLDQYLMVHKSILPEYYEKVLHARRLMESGQVREVSEAVRLAGISRSTYYKYKDYLFAPSDLAGSRRAVLSMLLRHEPGILSALLQKISQAGASVLTITQSPPIQGAASVTLSLELGSMLTDLDALLDTLSTIPGVRNLHLVAME